MSTPTSDRLSGVREKIERAKRHVCEFEERRRAFLDSDPYEVRTEDDPQTGRKIVRAKVNRPIPSELPLIIGDAVHNLRSALDHLVWQLADHSGALATMRPGDKHLLGFPMREQSPKDEAEFLRKIKGVCQAAVDIIKASQPYVTGVLDLWILSELDNIDKHHHLVVSGAAVAIGTGDHRGRLVSTRAYPAVELSTFIARPDAKKGDRIVDRLVIRKDGDEICCFVPDPDPQVDVKFQFAFEVAFGEPQIVKGQPVLPFLHQLADLVDGIVNLFVPFL